MKICSYAWRVVAGTIASLVSLAAAPEPGAARGIPGDTIVVGTVYNVFHAEYATDADFRRQVDRDVPAMAAAHITDVMIFPMSQWDPATRALRWDRTDYLVRKLEEHQLRFVPVLLKEEQCSHYFPIWKFKELGLWDARGQDNGNPNNRENVDFADPRVWPLLKQHVEAVIERYRDSPALGFYNVWNEPHYASTAPHVVERFRGWLQQKYGTLAALREAWGDDYADWSEVSPLLNDDWDSSMPGIDWAVFRSELQGQLLGELTAIVRAADPAHPVNANPVGTPFANFAPVAAYNTDNWQFTPHEDFAGASFYPDAWAREQGLDRAPTWFHNLSFTAFRSAAAGKEYLLTELYTNARNGLTLGGYLDADTARTLAWTALANDCKGLIYWKWQPFMRGRQSLGRGLVRLDGELAPRGEAVKEFGAVMGRHGPLLRRARLMPAEVAIAVDMVGLHKTLQAGEPRTQKFMYQSIAGTFRALDASNVSVDLLRVDRGIDLATLRRYKLVVLPFQIVMRRAFAQALTEYVRAGGVLVADARSATIDERDFAYSHSPGGLTEVFGAERIDWIAEPRSFRVVGDQAAGWVGPWDGKWFREQLRMQPGARVRAAFADEAGGGPALVENRCGAGRAILSAVPLGGSYEGDSAVVLERWFASLCQSAGVSSPEFRPTAGMAPHAMVRVHAAGDERVVYVINDTPEPVRGTLVLALPGTGEASATELIGERPAAVTLDGGEVQVPIDLPGRGTAVYHVKR